MLKNYFMLMNEDLLSGGGADPAPAPAAPESTPAPAPSVSIPENWKEALPETIRGEKSLEHIKTLEDMANSYLNAQKLVGADKVVIPHKNAEKSEWDNVFKKLGRPESPDKYEVNLGETKLPEETLNNLKKTAHELGLLPSQANEFIKKMNDSMVDAEAGLKTKLDSQLATATESLKKEWGTEFDIRLSKAQAVVNEFGGDDLKKYLAETGYGNDPMLVKAFYNIASQFGEDKFVGKESHTGGGMTPDAAMRKINELNSDPAFMDATHPKHGDLIAERSRLFRYAYPEEN